MVSRLTNFAQNLCRQGISIMGGNMFLDFHDRLEFGRRIYRDVKADGIVTKYSLSLVE